MKKTLCTIVAVAIIGLGCVGAQGCSLGITQGEIYAKEYLPASSSFWLMPAGDVLIPMILDEPEAYKIRIKDPQPVVENINAKGMNFKSGRYELNTLYVTKQEYERVKIGDNYTCQRPNCSLNR